jgi:drug/metabolite transporter (DMT)-like permease
MTDPAHEQRQRLKGIALMCGAVLLFAGNDAAAKYLNAYMPTLEVVWARYACAFLLGFAMSNPITRPQLLRTNRPWMQVGRSALLLVSTSLNFVALRYLQLDEAISIIFSTPFLVAVMGGPLLGEWIGWRRWTAIMVGFGGVLLVTRPGAGGIHPAALLSFGSAICYSLYSILTRVLAASDSSETTLFYSNLVGAVATTAILPWVWTPPQNLIVVAAMISMGLFSGFGHYLLIIGHRLAPAAVLAPFIYTEIVWMIALGYVLFGDVPNRWTLAGAAVVVGSGLYLVYRERKVRGQI